MVEKASRIFSFSYSYEILIHIQTGGLCTEVQI